MLKKKKINSVPRGLELEGLKIADYKIISVYVAKELDSQFRRTATAVVVTMNNDGIWDGNTMHEIELKHCYNKSSKGPNHTPYQALPGLILSIVGITSAEIADLDIVNWSLLNF